MDVNSALERPRLVLFRFQYEEDVPTFLRIHQEEHVKCLRQFFDVHVIANDCDYARVCDDVEPDLAVFETGLETARTHRLNICNTDAHPSIPKVALLNSDGCSELRSAILSDLDIWGIDTAFSISAVAPEHFGNLIPNLYVWPNFVDPSVFCDRGLPKLVPVILSGSTSPRYPWRREVFPKIIARCSVLVCPHPGYTAETRADFAMIGDEYARALNAARIAPTCGSISRELVRKHLEIPAARCCLVTEDTPTVRAAGFVDMVNCVFAGQSNILEKLEYLSTNPDRLAEITDKGYALVHSRHTHRERRHFLDWLNLSRSASNGQRIVQSDPFAPLSLTVGKEGERVSIFRSESLHLAECSAGRRYLRAGRYREAREAFQNCIGWLSEFPEARFGLVNCELLEGDAHAALSLLVSNLKQSLQSYGAEYPDPIEWAFLLICLLCLGRKRAARRRARQFAWLAHPELDRARSLVEVATGTKLSFDDPVAALNRPRNRPSIHSTLWQTTEEWRDTVTKILEQSGQWAIASEARRYMPASDHSVVATVSTRPHVGRRLVTAVRRWGWTRKKRVSVSRWDHPDLVYVLLSRIGVRLRQLFADDK